MALDDSDRGIQARHLIRSRDHAALATLLDGRPYVSLVATACDSDASPLLLLSDLAQHTKNLLADPQVSLLFDATAGLPDRLLLPVGPWHVGVLLRPRHPVEGQRASRYR